MLHVSSFSKIEKFMRYCNLGQIFLSLGLRESEFESQGRRTEKNKNKIDLFRFLK